MNIEFLEVLPEHKNKGIATALLEEIFTSVSADHKIVTSNGFTTDGKKYLTPLMRELAKKYGQEPDIVIGRC